MASSEVSFNDYLELCKPRVVALMLLTAVVGMFLATPGHVTPGLFCFAILGIGFTSAAGAVVNHLVDRRIDAIMARTERRPIPSGSISPLRAGLFAFGLASVGLLVLILFVNVLTAWLTVAALLGYALIYTVYLKRATPQNIVIGGLAGAMPPLLGWVAVTDQISAGGLLLVLIIFTWTPPHFWALAIYRYKDYAKAKIPMLPVTHGIAFTKLSILLYTVLMVIVTFLPSLIDMCGLVYLIGALLLNAGFIYFVLLLKIKTEAIIALQTFRYSIFYLLALFVVMLVDHSFMIRL